MPEFKLLQQTVHQHIDLENLQIKGNPHSLAQAKFHSSMLLNHCFSQDGTKIPNEKILKELRESIRLSREQLRNNAPALRLDLSGYRKCAELLEVEFPEV